MMHSIIFQTLLIITIVFSQVWGARSLVKIDWSGSEYTILGANHYEEPNTGAAAQFPGTMTVDDGRSPYIVRKLRNSSGKRFYVFTGHPQQPIVWNPHEEIEIQFNRKFLIAILTEFEADSQVFNHFARRQHR
ncbi:hypothetical protein PGTUg99_031811 [Puccinia graminis f. sp. tritici]|uniref:Uncharacterized protein n=1 Tax=Puccinia graminis f. sp. tritici TaxID=56615 RepID=A0A5B0PJT9_PUCGR|nr:hypothetical protein PGTUg99_031811 [Puccinia graminis f. sp. tritici]